MRKLIILLVVCFGATVSLRAQDRGSVLAALVERLIGEAASLAKQRTYSQKLVSEALARYEQEKRINEADQRKIQEQVKQINEAKARENQLKTRLDRVRDSVDQAFVEMESLKIRNDTLEKLHIQWLAERKATGYKLDSLGRQNLNLRADNEILAARFSRFNQFEFGYMQDGDFVSAKVTDGATLNSADEIVRFKDPRFLSNRLKEIKYNGTLCVPRSAGIKEIAGGKLFIYSDEKQLGSIPIKVKRSDDDQLSQTICYEIQGNAHTDFKLPENSSVRLAFIDFEKLKEADPADLEYFWVAEQKGLFTITSNNTSSKITNIAQKVLVKSAKVVDTVYVTDPELVIDIYDKGDNDGDIASFYVDGQLKFSKILLKGVAHTVKLMLDANETLITLSADSEGIYKLCTAYLVFKTKRDQSAGVTMAGTDYSAEAVRVIWVNK